MKVYVAAPFERKAEVLNLYRILKKRGHSVSFDWTVHKKIKPFTENLELAKKYSSEDIDGVKDSDVFILLSEREGCRGMHVELGAAIMSNVKSGKPAIFIAGDHNSGSLFYFHPCVKRRETVKQVLEEIDKDQLLATRKSPARSS
jgi:hypothetical protein